MASATIVERDKTSPFLVRAFVKVGGFHRPDLFEDGTVPTTDEHQIFIWKDTTLKELVNTLRLETNNTEIRHPLAKFGFRSLYADSSARGRIATRDLGMIYSRDILGESGTVETPAPRLLVDSEEDGDNGRTLEDLRFIPGDHMCISVSLPKHVSVGNTDLAIRGAAGGGAGAGTGANGWKGAGPLSPAGPPRGLGRGGGHWRGGSEPGAGRGRGGRIELSRRDLDRELADRDGRVPPPRRGRDSPPHRDLYTGRDDRRDRRDRRSRSPLSRSPPRRRYR